MGEKKRTLRGFLCAALGGVCWGASGTVGQYLFTCQGVDSGWLTVVRMFLAGVVLLGGALVRHRPQLRAIWSDRRDALRLVLFSVGGLMTCQYTYLAAIRYSNSATATVLQYMGQALILLWVCLRARKPARLHRAGQRDAVRGALAAHELRVAGSSRLCCHSGDGGAHRAARARVGKIDGEGGELKKEGAENREAAFPALIFSLCAGLKAAASAPVSPRSRRGWRSPRPARPAARPRRIPPRRRPSAS